MVRFAMRRLLGLGDGCAIAWMLPGALALVGCGGQHSPLPDEYGGGGQTSGVSATVASEYVTTHNLVRAQVTAPANYPGAWVALPEVTWSDEVAASAQQWANHLRDANGCHAALDENSAFGENGADGTVGFTATKAVNMWAAEKAQYVYSPTYAFSDNIGHYTQIVWRASTEIGCGIAQCNTGYLVHVCRYRPAGNVIGDQPY